MPLQLLHTITGCLIILCFTGKLIIHDYLNRLHGRASGITGFLLAPLPYFLPYRSLVQEKYISLKKKGDLLLAIAAISLFLNLILGLLIYFG